MVKGGGGEEEEEDEESGIGEEVLGFSHTASDCELLRERKREHCVLCVWCVLGREKN